MIASLGASLLALLCAQALPRARSHSHESTEASTTRAPLPLPLPEARRRRSPAGPDGARPRRPRRARPLDPAVLRALAAEDPPIAALRAAATALVLAEPERARSLVERARFAGWLPELRIMVDRRFARTESVDLGTPSDGAALAPVGIDSNNDVRYQARATWDLSKIIFNPRRGRPPSSRPCAPPTRVGRSSRWSSASTSSGAASRPSRRLPMTWTCFQVRGGSCASRRSRPSSTL